MIDAACRYFFLNAGILAAGLIAYCFVARAYTEKPVLSSEKVGKGGRVYSTAAAAGHCQAAVHTACVCSALLAVSHTTTTTGSGPLCFRSSLRIHT